MSIDKKASQWFEKNKDEYNLFNDPEEMIFDAFMAGAEGKDEMLKIVEAVAHIGVDFGYGNYELESKFIDLARSILDRNK